MSSRERGEGSVYLRGARYWVKYRAAGRVFRESSGSTRRQDALRLLRQRLADVQAGTHAPDASKVTFRDLEQLVFEDYRLNSRRGLQRIRAVFRHLGKTFAYSRAAAITSRSLQAYLAARHAAGAAPASIALELAILRRAFSLALRQGLLPTRPVFPTVRVANARAGFFEEPELRTVLEKVPAYLRAPILFAYYTGLKLPQESGHWVRWR